MTQDTINAIDFWISKYPESYHPCDMYRFYDIFISALKNNDLDSLSDFNFEELVRKYKKNAEDDWVAKFVHEWTLKIELCKDMLLYMREHSIV